MNKPITDLDSAKSQLMNFSTPPELRAKMEQVEVLKSINKTLQAILAELKNLKAVQKAD